MPDAKDKDLLEAFDTLKAEDRRVVPAFTVPPPGRWTLRPLVQILAAAAAVVCVLYVLLEMDRGAPAELQEDTIAFEELSDVISRELFVSSVSDWKSPTHFLLNPEL